LRSRVGSHFHVLRSRTRFQRYRGRRVPFSYFALPNSFLTLSRMSGPVFMFCAPKLIFGGTEGAASQFHVLRSRTLFQRYRGRRVLFLYFALPDSLLAVPSAPGTDFMLCAPGLIFDGTEGIRSHFQLLRSRTRFEQYRERQVPFLCFAHLDSFSTIQSASGPVFMFHAP
jgi:hypothetical protein